MTSYSSYHPNSAPLPRQEPLQNVSTIGSVAVVLAGCLSGVFLVEGLSALLVAGEYADAAREGRAAIDVLTWADLALLVEVPLTIATYAVTCLWLSRARENSVLLSPQLSHRRGKVWVWLGWWVPIVSVWFPFQVVRDVRNGSIGNRPPRAFVGLWWAAFLVFLTLERVVARMTSSTSPLTQEGADRILVASLLYGGMALVAGLLWIGVLREITADQAEETSAVGNLPQPPAAF